MPFEIIRRIEGEMSQKQEIRHSKVQISINDWGHLCIREFDEPEYTYDCEIGRENCPKEGERVCRDYLNDQYQCEHYKITREDDEHLLVFDRETTEKIIKFIFSIRSTFEFKELLRKIIETNGLPF